MSLKPPKHRLRARRQPKPVDHAARFQAAMNAVKFEDFARAEFLPCYLCSVPTSSWAVRITRRGDGSARLEMMHLCMKCRESGGVERLDKILDSAT